jgi:hypothetical protein
MGLKEFPGKKSRIEAGEQEKPAYPQITFSLWRFPKNVLKKSSK